MLFNKYIESIDISAIREYCLEHGCLCRYSKGESIVQQGAVGKNFGIIDSGYFKYTTITTDGNEAVVGFAFERECVCDFNNSFHSLPSEVSITAGCEATVWQVEFKAVKSILENQLTGLRNSINDALFREIYQRHLELYRKSPTERYLELINHHPGIFEIVTMREIASYLLITPVYLSRIRKKLSETERT